MRVLLVNPPLASPAGPYPAICYLAGFLDTLHVDATLADASLELTLRLFSRAGLDAVRAHVLEQAAMLEPDTPAVAAFTKHFDWYARTVETAIACLQGADQGAIARAIRPGYFPPPADPRGEWARTTFYNLQQHKAHLGSLTPEQEARLAASARPLRFAFGALGAVEEARYHASVVIRDLAHVITCAVDGDFALDAYTDRLRADAPTFEPVRARVERHPSLIDRMIEGIAADLSRAHHPDVVGLSVPFSGNVHGALRMARQFKAIRPAVRIVMGGGWVNTTLRELSDPGIFDYVDFITLDDGERPLQCVLELIDGRRSEERLLRTFVRRDGRVQLINGASESDVPFTQTGTPTYRDLPLRSYLNYGTTLRLRPPLWGIRWNKLTLAHGCYWKKCAFCDTRLDYIARYEPVSLEVAIGRIRRLMHETGESGFHFVDEAMPPALLKRLAERLIQEELAISWWGNVRFDDAFAGLAPLLARAGCVAMTGGLEVATDRVLGLMQKGVSLRQVARVTDALSRAGIIVHAYLIYGFPSQTVQETIDALEYVRQLFVAGCVQSVAWHRFALTAFSPVAAHPEQFGVRILPSTPRSFEKYVLDFEDGSRVDHGQFKTGLETAVSRYMVGMGFDRPVHTWFATPMPPTTLGPDYVRELIGDPADRRPGTTTVARPGTG